MTDAPDLGKKIGPLPLGGWVVVVAAALGVGYVMNKKKGATVDGGITAGYLAAELGAGQGGVGFERVAEPSRPVVQQTNQLWGQNVANWATGKGFPPLTADEAVRKYLSGQPLSIQEQAIISAALVFWGVPPEGVSGPANTAPAPVTGLSLTVVPDPDNNVVLVTWIPSPKATSYYIEQDGSSGPDRDTTTASSFSRWFVAAKSNVTFSVTARNDYGSSTPVRQTIYSGPVPINRGGGNPNPSGDAGRTRNYVVTYGDSLELIALKYGKLAADRSIIYNANQGVIEQAARNAGKENADGPGGIKGYYLYPGTVLVIP